MKTHLASGILMAVLAAAAGAAPAGEEPSQDGKTVPQWRAVLAGKDVRERPRAAAALARIGPPAAEALPALAKALAGSPKEENLRVNAALALLFLGKEAAAAAGPLARSLADPSSNLRRNAAAALAAIPADPAVVLGPLAKALSDEDAVVANAAAEALGNLGPAALPALEKLRDSSEGAVRRNLEAAIDRIAGKAVATGAGEEAPATPAGFSLHGGSHGGTVEIWR